LKRPSSDAGVGGCAAPKGLLGVLLSSSQFVQFYCFPIFCCIVISLRTVMWGPSASVSASRTVLPDSLAQTRRTQIISEEVSSSLTHSPVTKTHFLSPTVRLILPTALLKQLSKGRISYLVQRRCQLPRSYAVGGGWMNKDQWWSNTAETPVSVPRCTTQTKWLGLKPRDNDKLYLHQLLLYLYYYMLS
jgi:hypothetical protein